MTQNEVDLKRTDCFNKKTTKVMPGSVHNSFCIKSIRSKEFNQTCRAKKPENPRHSGICRSRANPRLRDREPSRINLKKVLRLLKIRKLRSKNKRKLMKSVPLSSKLYDIAMNYKQWRMKFVQKQYSFYGFFS